MSTHDNFRRAIETLHAAFDAVQNAPNSDTVRAFEEALAAVRDAHGPVLQRALERAKHARGEQ